MPDRTADFSVLLGPDYAGKSSVLSALAATAAPGQLISVDDEFLEPRHALLGTLRRRLYTDVLTAEPGTYSPEFASSLLQCAVVHVRDRIAAADPDLPVLVDSYYYKILAKCRLTGGEQPLFAWWRALPRPRQVVYLDVGPETAWRRAGEGARLNPMEYYGVPGGPVAYEDFAAFQTDLRAAMFEELGDVPVSVVHEQPDVAETVRVVRKVLHDHDDH